MAFTIANLADVFHENQAEIDSVDLGILVAALAGNGVIEGCAVTAQGSPDMTVAVAAGYVRVDGKVAAVLSGNVTVGTADGTHPRFDLITVNNAGTKACTAGTAAAEPVFPAIPANSVVIAAVYVPASDTTIASNQITDKRVIVFGEGTGLAAQLFGAGTDGDVTINSGTTTLTRDMFYRNLTLSGTGVLDTAGYRVHVSETLDLSAAPAGAIIRNGNAGGNAGSSTGGTAGATLADASLGGTVAAVNGANGGTAAGGGGGTGTTSTVAAGGVGGASGAGGAGSGGAGGASGGGGVITNLHLVNRAEIHLIRGVNTPQNAIIRGGTPGGGGGGGGGDGTAGGGGGATGTGGGTLGIWARTINRGGSTAASAVQAIGGAGGNGFTATAGNRGGGGGGGGAGGGWIYAVYERLAGSTGTNIFDASGGAGGNGGDGTGTGEGGDGGTGGTGGRITLINTTTGVCTETSGTAGAAGNANTGTTGGTGGAGGTRQASL